MSGTIYIFFFFQAEDGIRDKLVTGVQTCALPIAIASLGNGRLLDQGIVDIGTTGVDFVFKYRGFSLQGEGFVRNVNTHDPSKQVGYATGYYVSAGSFILAWTLELDRRWWAMDQD